jgi:nucleoside-diphosphate-sugar epimerase
MKIVILGGTGLIGSKVVNLLRAGGHEVVAASPSRGVNSITGEGLTEALTGAQVVPGQLPRLQWGRCSIVCLGVAAKPVAKARRSKSGVFTRG